MTKIKIGSLEDLTAQLIAAAKQFQEDGEGDAPNVVYAQLSNSDGWSCAFLQDSNALDGSMTRWSTGEDVSDLYAAILADSSAAVTDYAGDILAGWDSYWTD